MPIGLNCGADLIIPVMMNPILDLLQSKNWSVVLLQEPEESAK